MQIGHPALVVLQKHDLVPRRGAGSRGREGQDGRAGEELLDAGEGERGRVVALRRVERDMVLDHALVDGETVQLLGRWAGRTQREVVALLVWAGAREVDAEGGWKGAVDAGAEERFGEDGLPFGRL